jgi:hypothetical protein
MHLTREEEELLSSDNETIAKCMEILVAIGEIYDADRLIPVKSAQISGVSYDNIGDAGLEWLECLNARVKVPAYVNPAGMDVERWKEMGIDIEFYSKQMRVLKALQRIGAELSLTCTPYYLHTPSFGDHLAWAESSAVCYANSVVGARTNRESGITAIASAIIGKTPHYGLHVKENRAPTIYVRVRGAEVFNPSFLGYLLGDKIPGEIPLISLPRTVTEDELKQMGAAMAAKGNTALFHVEGVTPESGDFERPRERMEIDLAEIDFSSDDCTPDLIALGCPHLSPEELRKIFEIASEFTSLGGVKKEIWLFTSRKVYGENDELIKKLESIGFKVFCDTCMVVSPSTSRYECVMVNSGKALTYLPKLRGVNVIFGSIKDCIRRAFSDD